MESQTTLAVIVLYRVTADASQAFCSLRSLMAADPQAVAGVEGPCSRVFSDSRRYTSSASEAQQQCEAETLL